MRRMLLGLVPWMALTSVPAVADVPVTLRGSPASMSRQHQVARDLGLEFARTPAHIRQMEAAGELVRLEGNPDYGFREGMRSGVARPEMRTFIERLSAQYRSACGERLIVTSLTRAMSNQPSNSHPLSVHPTGMAVDLRISQRPACRQWLERTLLSLESQGLLDITRENSPPHYHVALFPEQYLAYLQRILGPESEPEPQLASAVEPVLDLAALGVNVAMSQLAANAGTTAPPERERERRASGWHFAAAVPLVGLVVGLMGKRVFGRGL
jgi:hypothetical protein